VTGLLKYTTYLIAGTVMSNDHVSLKVIPLLQAFSSAIFRICGASRSRCICRGCFEKRYI